MGIEDRDFIMRQVRQIAEGLGYLLSRQSLKELIKYDQAESAKLSDDDLDAIILIVDVKETAKKRKISEPQLAAQLNLTINAWQDIDDGLRFPTLQEVKAMRAFLVQPVTYDD